MCVFGMCAAVNLRQENTNSPEMFNIWKISCKRNANGLQKTFFLIPVDTIILFFWADDALFKILLQQLGFCPLWMILCFCRWFGLWKANVCTIVHLREVSYFAILRFSHDHTLLRFSYPEPCSYIPFPCIDFACLAMETIEKVPSIVD